MKLAYLILVHNQPEQLMRLVERLSGDDVHFYIHVDRKANIKNFVPVLALKQVFYVKKREKVHWGAYSIVQATINGFEEIIRAGIDYDYITLLSGQDYPLKSNDAIQQFFKLNNGKAFMEFYSVEDVWKEAIPRLRKYYLTNYPFSGSIKIETLINKFLPARKLPNGLVFVGRSQWFSITMEHINYIVQFIKTHNKIKNFFQFTWGSDEFVFQTILFNSPFKDQMVNDNLRLIDWSEGKASPKTFTIADADELLRSDKLFARKFNVNIDSAILDLLDKN